MESSSASVRILVATPSQNFEEYLSRNKSPFPDFVQSDIVKTTDQYNALPDKYSYDVVVVWFGGIFVSSVLNDQAKNSKKLRWVHALTAGIDNYLAAQDFTNADHIQLTNSKGCFNQSLGEFVALGMLYHSKKLEKFMANKENHKWEQDTIELVNKKTLAIVGFGDIGACAGKIAKHGFGAKVIGLKRRPE